MDELRDIKPLIDLGATWPRWWLAAVVATVVAFAIWLWRVRKRRRPAAPPPIARELALRALDAVAVPSVIAASDGQKLHTHLAVVLRLWIEQRFHVPGTSMTTEEIAVSSELARAFGAERHQALVRLLEAMDGVRFAGFFLNGREHAAVVEDARAFVAGFAQ